MLLSVPSQNRLMVVIVRDYQRKFTEALGLSARRGGFKHGMTFMLTRLIMWEKEGDTDFQKWFTLTQEAGAMWMNWYDWYSRIDQRMGRAS